LVENGELIGSSVAFKKNDAPGLVFDGWAGAILVLGKNSSLEFTNSEFVSNTAGVAGAIWIDSGKTSFKKCLFDSNLSRGGAFGGAVVPEGDSVNEFEDCEFANNYGDYGGAVDDGSIAKTLFKNCHFHDNRALYGGGYYSFTSSEATFEECIFEDNSADTGGAFKISSTSKPVFKSCVFRNNRATNGADGSIVGGALTTIIDCRFEENTSAISKTTLPVSAGHIAIQANVIVKGCKFVGGSALQGGSFYLRSSQSFEVTIEDSTFQSNSAVNQGGAVYLEGFVDSKYDPVILIKNCDFESNEAGTNGGAIAAMGSSNFKVTIDECRFTKNHGRNGGAVAIQESMKAIVKSCQFDSNSASTGGGLFVANSALVVVSQSTLVKNSARFGGSLAQSAEGSFQISNSIVRNGKATFQGGGFFASNLSSGCSRFQSVKFEQNEASVGGGGLFFAGRSPPLCMDARGGKKNGGSLEFCHKCEFVANKAGYGPDFATGASIMDPQNKPIKKLRPSEIFEMSFVMLDFYHQTLKGFIDTMVSVRVKNDTVLRGQLSKQPEKDGTVSFADLRWGVQPGEDVSILFYSTPTTTELAYVTHIANCDSDQLIYTRDTQEGNQTDEVITWYCLTIQDPDPIAQSLTYAGVGVVLGLSNRELSSLWISFRQTVQNAVDIQEYEDWEATSLKP